MKLFWSKTYYFLLVAFLLSGFCCYSSNDYITEYPTDFSALSITSEEHNAEAVSPPNQFFVYTVCSEFANIAWKDNSNNETGFKIFRKTADSEFILLNTIPEDSNKYTDTTVLPGATYTYKACATNPYGDSSYTEEITVSIPANDETSNSVILYDTPSDWAVSEIEAAKNYNLTNDSILNDYKKNITREEFCELAVKLSEALSGRPADYSSYNFFSDTTNVDILKAYKLGIVKGVTVDRFEPLKKISRQEICVMIYRTLKASIQDINIDVSDVSAFSDQESIAYWAINEVKFASKFGIIKGTGGNNIDPLLNTSREQAIVLVKRTYEAFITKK